MCEYLSAQAAWVYGFYVRVQCPMLVHLFHILCVSFFIFYIVASVCCEFAWCILLVGVSELELCFCDAVKQQTGPCSSFPSMGYYCPRSADIRHRQIAGTFE